MGAAAQFDRIALAGAGIAHREHAHFIAVFLAEQRHRPRFNRIVRAHQPGDDFLIAAHFGVHFGLDCSDIVGGQRGGLREVEPQPVWRDQ